MAVKKKGLGKGLDSLIPDNKPIKTVSSNNDSSEDDDLKSGAQMMKMLSQTETNLGKNLRKMHCWSCLIQLNSLELFSHLLYKSEKIIMR